MATTDEREYTPKPAQKWRYSTAANAALHDVMVQREEILAAFVAKYGFGPEEAIQVEQRRPDGTTTWGVERQAKPAPAPAPAANRPLWEVMRQARRVAKAVESSIASRYAAEIDAVADWLDARAVGVDAIVALHAEARRAREGA